MAKKQLGVRSVHFSHQESYLISKDTAENRCQIMVQLFENQKGEFWVNAMCHNLDDATMEEKKENFPYKEAALDWILATFDKFHFENGVPEVLFLPEWTTPEATASYVKKWADNLFGLKEKIS